MELVIDKELLGVYFKSFTPTQKCEKLQKLQLAIESEKNNIKISSEYLAILEDYFKSQSTNELNLFKTFLTSLSDNNRLISIKSKQKIRSEAEELEAIHNHDLNDYTFTLIKRNQPCLTSNSSIVNNIGVYESASKPNKDWFILSLISCFEFSISNSDFSSQIELDNIFQFCSKFPSKEKDIHIVDSYFNLVRNSQLLKFKGNGFKFKCYTSSFNKKQAEITNDRNSIKQFLGRNNTSVRFSKNKRIIHPRKIMIGNLVLDATHDFAEILLRNSNWRVYFIICNEKKSEFMTNISHYN